MKQIFKRISALAIALVMLMACCSALADAAETKPEVDSNVIALIGDVTVTNEEAAETYAYVLDMYSYYGYDVTDPDLLAQLKDITVQGAIAQKVYGADDVDFAAAASTELAKIEELGYGKLPVCMAKTQYSLTDNEKVLGRPTGFRITIRQVTLSAAAGFVVAITGAIMKMPGLPKVPSAEKIDVDANGKISGLF